MRNRESTSLWTKALMGAALVGTPLVLGAALLDVARESGATLGAVRGPPPNLAQPTSGGLQDDLFDVAPDLEGLDDPIKLPFDEPVNLKIDIKEEPAPLPPCDPVQVIRDSFKPSRERCRLLPSV